jgi:hypothetical protein
MVILLAAISGFPEILKKEPVVRECLEVIC